jgi:nitrogen fixation/metabolism regulation signal transduction histidine kinase
MSFKRIDYQQLRLFLVSLLFVTLLGALLMSSAALQNATRFGYLYAPLLVLSATGLIVLIILILINLRQLLRQVRTRRAGAKITLRVISLSVLLAVVPVLIVYYFSLEFLNRRLDSWFDVSIEQALKDALELSRSSLDVLMRDALQQTENLAANISAVERDLAALQLGELRSNSNAVEVSMLAGSGHIIAFNSAETGQLLPSRLPADALLKLKQQPTYMALEHIAERGLYIRIVVKCEPPQASPESDSTGASGACLLHALYPVAERFSRLATQVEEASNDYQQLVFLRQPLKWSFTLVLSLVLLLSIFAAVWVAFFAARRLLAPIRDLAEGTRAVAAGDYSTRLPVTSSDELGFLVQSFNEMTRRIRHAQEDVKQSQELADTQRAYLEVVLERLSSGVLTLDAQQCLRTGNSAAEKILDLSIAAFYEQNFRAMCAANPALETLCEALEKHLDQDHEEWQTEIALFGAGGRKVLMCRGKRLPPTADNNVGGHVIVFDDLTALIQAQRNAAWSEVARRLAHEIKNPLTPIQLSAERLRHKYLPSFPDKEADVLDRMTHTIIQQVEALKDMVNSFSDYARPPQLKLKALDLNSLVSEVLDLYSHQEARISAELAPGLPLLQADVGRLRQVLHNLIKNALEADSSGHIMVSTRYCCESTFSFVELAVADSGPGIDPEWLDRIFEPYVTSKPKGSGLGLAIVKKIIEEHSGMVTISNCPGARICIRLPCVGAALPSDAAT